MNNMPQSKKKKKSNMVLGVGDPKLGAAVQEVLDIPCQSGGVVLEVLRGVRLYFHRLVKGLTAPAAAKAQLGKSVGSFCWVCGQELVMFGVGLACPKIFTIVLLVLCLLYTTW